MTRVFGSFLPSGQPRQSLRIRRVEGHALFTQVVAENETPFTTEPETCKSEEHGAFRAQASLGRPLSRHLIVPHR